jgi:hypothetical protein
MLLPKNDASMVTWQVRLPRPNPDVVFSRLGEQIVLFHSRTDRFYELNTTAARFWELLAAGRDSVPIREQMLEEFAVDPDQLVAEIDRLLAALRQQDLLTNDD